MAAHALSLRRSLLLVLWLALSPQAWAQADAGLPSAAPVPAVSGRSAPSAALEEEGMEQESLGATLFRTVVVLVAVIAVIYLVLNVGLRRLMGLHVRGDPREALVSVVERIPLDPKRSLFVLRAAGEYLLVGGGEAGLQLLSKLDAAEVERIRNASPPPPGPGNPFLQKLLSRRGGPPPSST